MPPVHWMPGAVAPFAPPSARHCPLVIFGPPCCDILATSLAAQHCGCNKYLRKCQWLESSVEGRLQLIAGSNGVVITPNITLHS